MQSGCLRRTPRLKVTQRPPTPSGGDPKAQQCGWLKDKYGLSWQVVPVKMGEFFKDEKSGGAQRAMEAMLPMKKLDIAKLKKAYAGKA